MHHPLLLNVHNGMGKLFYKDQKYEQALEYPYFKKKKKRKKKKKEVKTTKENKNSFIFFLYSN